MQLAEVTHTFIKPFLNSLNPSIAEAIHENTIQNLLREHKSWLTPKRNKKYIEIVIEKSKDAYYLIPSLNPAEPGLGLLSKNLKAIMFISLNTTKKDFLELYHSKFILDLLNIHSFQKGEGKKLMATFIEIQKELNIPGSLWTESLDNVKYFKKYGFKNLGSLGINNEFLMMRPIDASK